MHTYPVPLVISKTKQKIKKNKGKDRETKEINWLHGWCCRKHCACLWHATFYVYVMQELGKPRGSLR